jgi:hypothetical protein
MPWVRHLFYVQWRPVIERAAGTRPSTAVCNLPRLRPMPEMQRNGDADRFGCCNRFEWIAELGARMTSDNGPFDVRHIMGVGWQISLIDSGQWHNCRSELDARFIANGMHLARTTTSGRPADEETAQELDEAASVAVRNLGECWAVKLIRDGATRARAAAAF